MKSSTRNQAGRFIWTIALGSCLIVPGRCRAREPDTILSHKAGFSRILGFPANAARVATAHQDSSVKIWDAASGKLLHNIRKLDHAVLPRSGDILATLHLARRRVVFWNVASKRIQRMNRHVEIPVRRLSSITFSPDGTTVAISAAGKVLFLRRDDPKHNRVVYVDGPNHSLIFSPSGKVLAVGGPSTGKKYDQQLGEVRLIEVATGDILTKVRDAFEWTFTPDGEGFGVRDDNEYVSIFDCRDGKELKSVSDSMYDNGINSCFAISNQGRVVFGTTGVKPGYKTLTTLALRRFVVGSSVVTESLILRQSTPGSPGAIQFYGEAVDGKVAQFPMAKEGISLLKFSPDEKTLFVGLSSGSQSQIWNTVPPAKRETIHGGYQAVFSNDSRSVATLLDPNKLAVYRLD